MKDASLIIDLFLDVILFDCFDDLLQKNTFDEVGLNKYALVLESHGLHVLGRFGALFLVED